MPTDIIIRESADLAAQREELATLRNTLAERELEAADLRAHLRSFEGLYLRQVGILYAELDDWNARIAEREVALYDSPEARERAAEARRQAHETHEAAFGDAREAEEFDQHATLKALFREVAKRIHPDFARDAAEAEHCTRLMARANKAYTRGDLDTLQRLLDDYHEVSAADDEGPGAELLRLHRQIQHARRDIAAIEQEIHALPTSEIAQLRDEAEAASVEGRNLLAELATALREKIAEAKYRHEFLERQLRAFGK